MKICVYAIAKNESKFVSRFCDAAKDADLILIADTGSSDNTMELAEEQGAAVYNINISPWRFDTARNVALALIPDDLDVCISLDLDEVLEDGWREVVEAAWATGVTRLEYNYNWGHGLQFKYGKIHARHGYQWKHPCHEYLFPDPRITEVSASTEKTLVSHYPDDTKPRSDYLHILEAAVKEDKWSTRNSFYYARELFYNQKWQECVKEFDRYLNLVDFKTDAERCFAIRHMAKCSHNLGYKYAAASYLKIAQMSFGKTREVWTDAALVYYKDSEWQLCLEACKSALETTERQWMHTDDPTAWGELPYDIAAIAAHHLGYNKEALSYAKEAVAINPNDIRLQNNLSIFKGLTKSYT